MSGQQEAVNSKVVDLFLIYSVRFYQHGNHWLHTTTKWIDCLVEAEHRIIDKVIGGIKYLQLLSLLPVTEFSFFQSLTF